MIVNDKDIAARLSSPMNLMNRLRRINENDKRSNAMSLFIKPGADVEVKKEDDEIKYSFNPFQTKKDQASPEPSSGVALAKASLPQPSIDDISQDPDSKIKLGLAHDKALSLLTDSLSALQLKLDDVSAAKLPSVIAAAARTVEGIRKERNEASKNNKNGEVHYHFYTPQQKKITDYEVIEVSQ